MRRRILGISTGLAAVGLATLMVSGNPAVMAVEYPPSPEAFEPSQGPGGGPAPQPVEPGRFEANGTIVIDGVQSAVRIRQDHSAGTFRITGRGIDMVLTSVGPAGVTLPLGADGSLLLIPGGNLQATGKGFAPTSTIVLWLLSSPIQLGQTTADSAGVVTTRTRIPATVLPGAHHAQAFGYTPGGLSFRATIPARVLSRPLEAHRQRVGTSVYFDELSSTVVPGERQALDALIAQVAPTARRIRVTVAGYVQPSATTANDMSLSTRRAIAVSRYLRRNGVRGVYLVSGRGVSSVPGAAGRHSEVRIVVTVLR